MISLAFCASNNFLPCPSLLTPLSACIIRSSNPITIAVDCRSWLFFSCTNCCNTFISPPCTIRCSTCLLDRAEAQPLPPPYQSKPLLRVPAECTDTLARPSISIHRYIRSRRSVRIIVFVCFPLVWSVAGCEVRMYCELALSLLHHQCFGPRFPLYLPFAGDAGKEREREKKKGRNWDFLAMSWPRDSNRKDAIRAGRGVAGLFAIRPPIHFTCPGIEARTYNHDNYHQQNLGDNSGQGGEHEHEHVLLLYTSNGSTSAMAWPPCTWCVWMDGYSSGPLATQHHHHHQRRCCAGTDDDSHNHRPLLCSILAAARRWNLLDARQTPAWRAGPSPAQTIWASTGSSLSFAATPSIANRPIP